MTDNTQQARAASIPDAAIEAAAMTDDEIDLYYCCGCEGDTRSEDHFGCTYCGDCKCEGGC